MYVDVENLILRVQDLKDRLNDEELIYDDEDLTLATVIAVLKSLDKNADE